MPHYCLDLPLHSSPNCFIITYIYPLWISLTITSDHHSHQPLCIRPPFLLSTFLFILSVPFGIHCLISRTTFWYLSPFLIIFNYTASLSVTPPYAHPFPFLPFSFPSHSYWLYYYIFTLALTHSHIHLLSHWLTIVLLLFLYRSEHPSHSYWSIARLSPLDKLDSIATFSCIYTYHE